MRQIKEFYVDGYRSLSKVALRELKRVNLFVGRNGAGKSSMLEALYLFFSGAPIDAIIGIALRRGEYDLADDNRTWLPSLRHLFAGHAVQPGCSEFVTKSESASVSFGLTVQQLPKKDDYRIVLPTLSCVVSTQDETGHGTHQFPVERNGGIDLSYHGDGGYNKPLIPEDPSVVYIDPEGVESSAMLRMRDDVVSMGEEPLLAEALKMLDSSVESVGFLSPVEKTYTSLVNGTLVGLAGKEGRVPVKTLGDGMRRLLTIAMGVVCARGGVLIIDEIDAGLHYSVMDSLWKFVCDAAERYDVQVFASTHSQDCLRGLAVRCSEMDNANEHVMLYALGGKSNRVVSYTAEEIHVAVEQEIEVRT